MSRKGWLRENVASRANRKAIFDPSDMLGVNIIVDIRYQYKTIYTDYT